MSGRTGTPFEELYAAAGEDLTRIPWANLRAHPRLVEWLNQCPADRPGRALVVGCGLGDDAAELARRGYQVTAFDASPTAIGWSRRRFPDAGVDFRLADVLALPTSWRLAFRLVVEINTVQSLPLSQRSAVIAAIASTVASGGELFVRCYLRADDEPVHDRPWPVSRAELAELAGHGLCQASFEITDITPSGHRYARSIWQR